jgi:hypothetical protein
MAQTVPTNSSVRQRQGSFMITKRRNWLRAHKKRCVQSSFVSRYMVKKKELDNAFPSAEFYEPSKLTAFRYFAVPESISHTI